MRLRAVCVPCNRCAELLTDLLAQLATRRFVRTLLDDAHVQESCALAPLAQPSTPAGATFGALLEQLAFYMGFEIEDQTGDALSEAEVLAAHLQKVVTKKQQEEPHRKQQYARSNMRQQLPRDPML